jgi:hypothetical protein
MGLWALTIAIGSVAFEKFYNTNAYTSTGTDKLTQMYDMGRDWQQSTYTAIKVIDDFDCGTDWEPTFSRIFGGAETGCDCLGISSRYINQDNEFIVGDSCDRNETRAGCNTPDPFPATRMSRLEGKVVCG